MENIFNVPVEMFRLEKITINKQKTCEVKFVITDTRGDHNYEYQGGIKPNYQCTEALQRKLSELKPYLCDIHHIEESIRSKVSVTGVEMSGMGDKATFKIHGVQLSDSEQNMRFSTCKVQYEGGYYGFESEVTDIIDDLEILAHGYAFEGKKADITLGLSGADDESDDDENEVYNDDDESEITEVEFEESETVEE